MNLLNKLNPAVSRDLPQLCGGIEGLLCEQEDKYRIGNYLEEQGYQEEWQTFQEQDKRIGVLKNVWVLEESKGKGFGSELVQWFIDEAVEREMEAVYLVADMHESNELNLVSWYESYGFQVVAERGGDPLMCWRVQENT